MGDVADLFDARALRSHDSAAYIGLSVTRASAAMRFHMECGPDCVTQAVAARILRNSR